MCISSRKKLPSNCPPANGLAASQSTQQPRPVCTWSAHTPQSGQSPLPFPRNGHTLTATATLTGTAAGELFLFGGYVHGSASSDLYLFSTRDFSTTLLKTSGEVPTPCGAHGATLIGTTLLICGSKMKGKVDSGDQNEMNYDSLYLLNLGTSNPLMSSLTPADYNFLLQYRESGPALWSKVLGPMTVTTQQQLWSAPSCSSSVVGLAGRLSMICGHSI